jgi:hypothetical protein
MTFCPFRVLFQVPPESLLLPTIPMFSPSRITSSTPEFDPLDPVLTQVFNQAFEHNYQESVFPVVNDRSPNSSPPSLISISSSDEDLTKNYQDYDTTSVKAWREEAPDTQPASTPPKTPPLHNYRNKKC